MKRVSLLVCLSLVVAGTVARAEDPPPDAEIERGIRQVEEGDYDAAILSLDGAVRRLAADPARSPELARAYLQLGIAYLAKGYETSARARFRDALARARDLELPPEKYAPRVIELFEQARQDVASGASTNKKGGKKGLIIAGVVAAGGGGAALALAGGGGGGAGGAGGGGGAVDPVDFGGVLDPQGSLSAQHVLPPSSQARNCEARLTWSDGHTEVRMFVLDAATGQAVTETNRMTDSSSAAQWSCGPSTTYRIELFLQEPFVRVTYQLRVSRS